ncbi:MAG: RIP metalloprotease RseP [Syntrophobacteraceae bacterium]
MLTILLSTAIVLGILIFVHELGHFLVAKRSGVTVLRFSLGFGPKIFGITRGATEYCLSLIPLGGYVKMLGEDSEEELSPSERAGAFSEQSVMKRLAIVVAGPLSNFVLAIILFTFLFAFSGIHELAPEIGSVNPGSPAEQAGLQAGDRVVSIDGRPIATWEDLSETIEKLGSNPLNIRLKRADAEIAVTVTPKIDEVKNLFGETIRRPLIGIAASESTIVRSVNPLAAGYYALVRTYDLSRLFFLTVVKLIERIVPLNTLGGPILIAQMAGKQAQKGVLDLLNFMAFISVNLAVLNLLPIPVLDGGHIFFFLIEAVLGRPLSLKKIAIAQKVGLLALLSLMVVVFYNDLMRLDWSSVASWLHNLLSRL